MKPVYSWLTEATQRPSCVLDHKETQISGETFSSYRFNTVLREGFTWELRRSKAGGEKAQESTVTKAHKEWQTQIPNSKVRNQIVKKGIHKHPGNSLNTNGQLND